MNLVTKVITTKIVSVNAVDTYSTNVKAISEDKTIVNEEK